MQSGGTLQGRPGDWGRLSGWRCEHAPMRRCTLAQQAAFQRGRRVVSGLFGWTLMPGLCSELAY